MRPWTAPERATPAFACCQAILQKLWPLVIWESKEPAIQVGILTVRRCTHLIVRRRDPSQDRHRYEKKRHREMDDRSPSGREEGCSAPECVTLGANVA